MRTLQPTNPLSFTRSPHSANTKQINDYLIDLNCMIGEGSFSKVYKARNLKTNETVAVKIVELSTLKSDTLIKLLQSEIDLLKVLKHPNVLNCYEILSSSNNCYIVTEYCNGGDLETHLNKQKQKRGMLSDREFKKIVWEAYQGLKYVAGHNIIHRDFKIANIFLNNGVAKLADFGFAQRLKHAEQRFTDVNIGSPVYMAPEAMIANTYGPKTDVWSFGIFVYEMLHGDTPLGYCETEQELLEGVKRQLTSQDISPTVSAILRDLMLKCLQVDERRRISVAQIGHQAYILQLEGEFGRSNAKDASKQTNVSSKQFESERMMTQNSQRVSMSHLNIPPQHRSLSHMSIGPSMASQLMSESQYSNLSHMVPSSHSQLVLLNHRNSSQGLNSQNSVLKQLSPTMNFSKNAQKNQMTTTIFNKQGTNNSSSTNLLKSKITFSQCVQLLHYCRLIHKCIATGGKIASCRNLGDCLSAWLLGLTEELKTKCLTHVQFDGERAPLREKKLNDLIDQYYVKYRQQLRSSIDGPFLGSCSRQIQECLVILDRDIHLSRNGFEVDLMVRMAHLLATLYEVNAEIEKASQSGDFSRLAMLKMDEFLNRPNESFTMESYNKIKSRVMSSFVVG